MKDNLLRTPEGVRDIYGYECERKTIVMNNIHEVLHLYGNQDIETPAFEYFEIFNHDKGSAPSSDMYKFFDRENNTLVLRPDFTPSVARSVAKYFADEELPIRLCYKGNVFVNTPQHQGKQSEMTEMGCELINDASSAADAEMVACIIDCLKASGLDEFLIEIGEVDYFKGLIEEAGVDYNTEKAIRGYIQKKDFFGLSDHVSKLDIPENVKNAFDNFDTLFGGPEMLDKAMGYTTNARAKEAIDRMRRVYAALSYYHYDQYINFDLSMINDYEYYTGIVFSGYTYDIGTPFVRGGRYNDLLKKYGKDAPSIGFVILIDELMKALMRQGIPYETMNDTAMILYDQELQDSAVALASKLRDKGIDTNLIRKSKRHEEEEYLNYAARYSLSNIYILMDDKNMRHLDRLLGTDEIISINDLEALDEIPYSSPC